MASLTLGRSRELAVTIASSAQTSSDVSIGSFHTFSIAIVAPATLTGVVTVHVSLDGSTFVALQSAGADVTIAAGKAVVLSPFPFSHIRFVSSQAEGATRSFFLRGLPRV